MWGGLKQAMKALGVRRFWRQSRLQDSRSVERELKVVPLLCDKEKLSVDIGADQGDYAFVLARASAGCIVFEPRLADAARIHNKADAERLPIEVEAVALSDCIGTASLRVLTRDLGRSTIESANPLHDPDGSPRSEIRVPKLRLDDFQLDRVGFIKIDVEGHELAVLKGAEATLRRSMPNLVVEIEERHNQDSIRNVSAFLAGFGYAGFFFLDDNTVLPLAQFDQSKHQDPANVGGWKENWVRRGVYINNFFFLPHDKSCLLVSRLLKSFA